MSPETKIPKSATAILACSKCGSPLPDGTQFCVNCGKPVAVPRQDEPEVEVISPSLRKPKQKRRTLLWLMLALLVALVAWIAVSDSPFAQGLQELAGVKQDRAVLAAPFTVAPHNLRFYKFSLPEGSVHVSIVGQFSATADTRDKKSADSDNAIEVYVLSEPAFAVWQNGYAASSVYESGRVSQGNVQAELPAGAGIYYLVFSNKFAPKTGKNVNASVMLRYKSWVPNWFRRMKETVNNWFGL